MEGRTGKEKGVGKGGRGKTRVEDGEFEGGVWRVEGRGRERLSASKMVKSSL